MDAGQVGADVRHVDLVARGAQLDPAPVAGRQPHPHLGVGTDRERPQPEVEVELEPARAPHRVADDGRQVRLVAGQQVRRGRDQLVLAEERQPRVAPAAGPAAARDDLGVHAVLGAVPLEHLELGQPPVLDEMGLHPVEADRLVAHRGGHLRQQPLRQAQDRRVLGGIVEVHRADHRGHVDVQQVLGDLRAGPAQRGVLQAGQHHLGGVDPVDEVGHPPRVLGDGELTAVALAPEVDRLLEHVDRPRRGVRRHADGVVLVEHVGEGQPVLVPERPPVDLVPDHPVQRQLGELPHRGAQPGLLERQPVGVGRPHPQRVEAAGVAGDHVGAGRVERGHHVRERAARHQVVAVDEGQELRPGCARCRCCAPVRGPTAPAPPRGSGRRPRRTPRRGRGCRRWTRRRPAPPRRRAASAGAARPGTA